MFLYIPTSAIVSTPLQAHSPEPMTGARHAPSCAPSPPSEVPKVECTSRGPSRVRATTWRVPSPVSFAAWPTLVETARSLCGSLCRLSGRHPPQRQRVCSQYCKPCRSYHCGRQITCCGRQVHGDSFQRKHMESIIIQRLDTIICSLDGVNEKGYTCL